MLSGLLDLTVIVREGQIKFYHSLSLDFGSQRLSQVSGLTFICPQRDTSRRRFHTGMSKGTEKGHEERQEQENCSRTRRVGRETQM